MSLANMILATLVLIQFIALLLTREKYRFRILDLEESHQTELKFKTDQYFQLGYIQGTQDEVKHHEYMSTIDTERYANTN